MSGSDGSRDPTTNLVQDELDDPEGAHQAQAACNNKGGNKPNSVIAILKRIGHPARANDQDRNPPPKKRLEGFRLWADRWRHVLTFVFAVLSFLLTVALAGATIALFCIARLQAGIMSDTLDQAKLDSEVALRAYPYLQEPELVFKKGEAPKLRFQIGNSGQTPARDIVIRARVFYGVSPDRCALAGGLDKRVIKFEIPGGGQVREPIRVILDKNRVTSDFAGILDKPPSNWSRRTIKVEGRIEYRTIFTPADKPRERTPFLFFAEPVNSVKSATIKF